MKMKRLAAVALAAGLVVGPAAVMVPAASADAACCYKIPNGTWGAYVKTVDVHLYWRDRDTEIRRKTVVKKRYYDGRWVERVYSIELYAVRHNV